MNHRVILRLLIFSLGFIGGISPGFCQEQYIYNITASDCNLSAGSFVSFAAFRLRGQSGLLTSLHGVCRCSGITATDQNGHVYQGLKIIKADIQNDVCVISSDAIDALGDAGIGVGSPGFEDRLRNSKATVIGFPLGMHDSYRIQVLINDKPIRQLANIIDDAAADQLRTRKSPNVNTTVIGIQGGVVPGQSGAPLIFESGVVGITDGGLRGGIGGYGWAIPINNLSLKPVGQLDNDPVFRSLRNGSSDNLFEYVHFNTEEEAQPTPREQFCNSFKKLLTETANGFPNLAGSVRNDDRGVSGIIYYNTTSQLPKSRDSYLSIKTDVAGFKTGFASFNYDKINAEIQDPEAGPLAQSKSIDKKSLQYSIIFAEFSQLEDMVKSCLPPGQYTFKEPTSPFVGDKTYLFVAVRNDNRVSVGVSLMDLGIFWQLDVAFFNLQ